MNDEMNHNFRCSGNTSDDKNHTACAAADQQSEFVINFAELFHEKMFKNCL